MVESGGPAPVRSRIPAGGPKMSVDAQPSAQCILVVDDSPVDRAVVAGILEEQGGYAVQHAGNGREALECLASLQPAAVVTDLYMPEMNGMELVRAVRRQHGSVPVILITARGSEQTAMDALACGAADYVPKSRLHSRLIDSLEEVLAMAASRLARHRLAAALEYQELRYSLENDAALFAPLSQSLARDRHGPEAGRPDRGDASGEGPDRGPPQRDAPRQFRAARRRSTRTAPTCPPATRT